MNTVVATLVAVLTKWDAQPVQALLDMMSIRWPSLTADSTWQRLDRGQMLAIRGCQILAIHSVPAKAANGFIHGKQTTLSFVKLLHGGIRRPI